MSAAPTDARRRSQISGNESSARTKYSQTQAARSGHFITLYEQSSDEGFAFEKKLGTVEDSTGSGHLVYLTSSPEGTLPGILGP